MKHVLVLVALTGVVRAEVVHGTVIDRTTRAPVAGVVVATETAIEGTADDGTFTLTLPPGNHTISLDGPIARITVDVTLARGETKELLLETDPSGEEIEVT